MVRIAVLALVLSAVASAQEAAAAPLLHGSAAGQSWTLAGTAGSAPCGTLRVGTGPKRSEAHECFDDFLLVGVGALPVCDVERVWLYGVAPRRAARVVVIANGRRRAAHVSHHFRAGSFWTAVVPASVTRLRVSARSAANADLDTATVGVDGACDSS